MTSLPPPTYYFNGITFNSAYYATSSSGGFTQAQANALYLKKTTADTASALETFSGGILTNSINPTTTTGTVAIGTSSTLTTLAGGVTISNTFTTPTIDPVTSGGNFNIGNVTPSTINIGTASATAVNIGSSSAVTTTNGALTATGLITANNSLKTPAIDPVNSGGNFNIGNVTPSTINIGTASATAVNIGSSSAVTTTNGALTATGGIACNTYNSSGAGATTTLGANNLTGNIEIGNGNRTAGTISIGSGTTNASTSAISIGSELTPINLKGTAFVYGINASSTGVNADILNLGAGNTTKTVNLGTNANVTAMNVGSSNTAAVFNGDCKFTKALQTPSIDPAISGGSFNIGNVLPSTINVGTASATAVNIGSSSALTTTNGALTATGALTSNNSKFKIASSGASFPVSLLLGDSTDTTRAVSILNSALASGTITYMTIGQSQTTNNQTEIAFNYNGPTGNNFTTLGMYGLLQIAYGGKNYVSIGAPPSGISTASLMNAGLAGAPNSAVILCGNPTRTDGPAIIANTDSNWLMNFVNSAGTGSKGSIQSGTASSVSYTTSSDRRLKQNITPMSSMIDKIKQLNPAHYEWIEDGIMDDGFIAQEVHKIFPNFIGNMATYCDACKISRNDIYKGKLCSCCDWDSPTNKDGIMYRYGLDYSRFTPYLTKALQESIELIDKQQLQIEALQTQVQTILQTLNIPT